MTNKLYRCPVCGDVLTEEEYSAQFESGGSGYCYCQFSDGNRILIDYEVFVREETNVSK